MTPSGHKFNVYTGKTEEWYTSNLGSQVYQLSSFSSCETYDLGFDGNEREQKSDNPVEKVGREDCLQALS